MGGKLHWGVDSFARADTPWGNKTLYDFVVHNCKGRRPEFWGRYIGGIDKKPKTGVQNGFLTTEEIAFLKARGCRILCIYTGLRTSVTKDDKQGRADAADACRVAQKVLRIDPHGTWIYADIEPDYPKVQGAWMQGWMEQIHASPFGGAGGFYAPTGNPGFNSIFCPVFKAEGEGNPPKIPDVRRRVNLYALSPSGKERCPVDPMAVAYTPDKPACHADGVVIWQYATGCLETSAWSVDMDLATERGFQSMWDPVEKYRGAPTSPNRASTLVDGVRDGAGSSVGTHGEAAPEVFTDAGDPASN